MATKITNQNSVGAQIKQTVPVGIVNQNPDYPSNDPFDVYQKNGNNSDKEPVFKPDLHIWKTPGGHMLELDDTGLLNSSINSDSAKIDNAGIRLTTKKGNLLHLTDENSKLGIFIKDSKMNYIWLDSTKNDGYLNINRNWRETIRKNKTITVLKDYVAHVKEKVIFIVGQIYSLVADTVNIGSRQVTNVSSQQTLNLAAAQSVNITGGVNVTLNAIDKVSMGGISEARLDSATFTVISSEGITVIKGSLVLINPPGDW